jgi:hypothetical protein
MWLLRAASLVVALLGARAAPAPADQPPSLSPHLQKVLALYQRYPVAYADVLLATFDRESGPLNPIHALLLGDAALRTGRYQLATKLFTQVRDGDGGAPVSSSAEIGLASVMLGRGRLEDAYAHLAAAGTLNPDVRSTTDVAMALVGAARGDPDAGAALAAAAARSDLDPGFREVAPLLGAYAHLWSRDAVRAADAFTAFAVAHPDSRFTDDALYAAAQAKERVGRTTEVRSDLEALASNQRGGSRASSRLRDLDGRALLRAGMRRDRELGARSPAQRFADLLDGDGGSLARAALAAADREAAHPVAERRSDGRGAEHRAPGRGTGLADEHGGTEPDRSGTRAPVSSARRSPVSTESSRMPWAVVIALAAPLLLLAFWLLGRGRAARSS